MNEIKRERRVEDKRADGTVDWTDAPRFTALGIAETWAVTVEAEGQMVLSIGSDHVAGLDSETLEQFAPTIRSCAQHLLGFIGAAPVSSTAGAAKGGNTSDNGSSVLAHAGVTAEPADLGHVLRTLRSMLDGSQLKDTVGAVMVIDNALKNGIAWSYDIAPPQGFVSYVKANYYGDVHFHDPEWHATRLWNAAMKNAGALISTIPAQVPAAEVRAQALEEAAKVADGFCDHIRQYTTDVPAIGYAILSLAKQSPADKASEVRAAEKGGA